MSTRFEALVVRLLVFSTALLLCSVASAQQVRRFELSWQAPQSCPVSEAVAREIDDLLAGANPASTTTRIMTSASITKDGEGFSLSLAVRDGDGLHERRLAAPTCEELGHAAALIVALAIDPGLLAMHPDPGGLSSASTSSRSAAFPPAFTANGSAAATAKRAEPAAAPRIALSSVAPTQSAYAPRQRVAHRFRLGLSEFVAYRTLPGINVGTGAFAAVQIDSVRLEAMLSGLLAEARASNPGDGATFSLYRLAAKGCWLARGNGWALGPCADMEIGLLRGHGYGVDVTRNPEGLWLGSALGMLLDLRLTESTLFGVAADAEVPWRRDEFVLAGVLLYKPRIAGRFGVSLSAGW